MIDDFVGLSTLNCGAGPAAKTPMPAPATITLRVLVVLMAALLIAA